jgi:phage/plasmid-associated DNA primase
VAKRSREYSIFVKSNFDPFAAQYFNHEYLIAAMLMAQAYFTEVKNDRHGGVMLFGTGRTGKSTLRSMI